MTVPDRCGLPAGGLFVLDVAGPRPELHGKGAPARGSRRNPVASRAGGGSCDRVLIRRESVGSALMHAVHDLGGLGKLLRGDGPDPGGAVAEDG